MVSQRYLLRVENYFKQIYQTPILENSLGLQIVEIAEGKACFRIDIIDKHCNIYGFVHGGTFASIADVAMGAACMTLGNRIVTSDMSISYIKNVPKGSTITAVGEVISNGKTIMRAAGKIFDQQQQLLITSQASYYITGDFDENAYLRFEELTQLLRNSVTVENT